MILDNFSLCRYNQFDNGDFHCTELTSHFKMRIYLLGRTSFWLILILRLAIQSTIIFFQVRFRQCNKIRLFDYRLASFWTQVFFCLRISIIDEHLLTRVTGKQKLNSPYEYSFSYEIYGQRKKNYDTKTFNIFVFC